MATANCPSLRFSLPPILPSPAVKRVVLQMNSCPTYSSSKRRFLRAPVGSGCFRQCVRSMGTERSPQEVEVPRSVPVRVAHELLQPGHRYLDVRTPEEFGAGRPIGAINIPYMFRIGSGMSKNPKFLEEVSSIFGKDDEIIVGCQSGKRSLMAATDLTSSGFTGVTDVAGGYSAWVQNELPSEL